MGRVVVLLFALALAAACGRGQTHGAIVVVLDTLRADHLGVYGYPRDTSPAIDRLAERGVLFEQAVSPSSWTLPATIALLSGRYVTAEVFSGGLRTSLVETLGAAGIRTAAFTEGGFVSEHFGLDRGFEAWQESEGPVRLVRAGHRTQDGGEGGIEHTFARARQWLRDHGEQPFFLLIHTYEVHTPYRRPPRGGAAGRGRLGETFEIGDVERVRQGEIELGDTELDYLARLYDGGVAEADRQVGALLADLDLLGLRDRTLVVVTSDHGEDLGARDRRFAADHGHSLYDELTRVPLIFAAPGAPRPGLRIRQQVSLLDVMPTVLAWFGLEVPAGLGGSSLLPALHGTEIEHRPLLMRQFARSGASLRPLRTAWRDGVTKLVLNFPFLEPSAPTVELFDLAADPGERVNVAERRPEARDDRIQQLRQLERVLDAEGLADLRAAGDVPAALRERLESLGYGH